MSGLGTPQGLKDIGTEANPPYAVLPDPSTLFLARSKRLRDLAVERPLKPYLEFLAGMTEAQHSALASLPPAVLPDAGQIQQALEHGIPPLARAAFEPGEAGEAVMRALMESLRHTPVPGEAAAAIQSLATADAAQLRKVMSAALKDTPPEDVAQRVLVLAGLQVHFTRLAALLDAETLKPVADGVCPVCGSPPMTSSVVGWPKANNSRYCTCPLCATMWNVVRIKCVLCSSTEGIGYHLAEGQPETVKAETCEKCGRYVKVLYQVKDHLLDPLADDVATLDLDMLLAKEGWKRGGSNPFLLGY
jgi:FdhE protein